jgi:hypothetical protein
MNKYTEPTFAERMAELARQNAELREQLRKCKGWARQKCAVLAAALGQGELDCRRCVDREFCPAKQGRLFAQGDRP